MRARWRHGRPWQKAALIVLPLAALVVVAGVLLASPEEPRPAGEPEGSLATALAVRGLVVFDGCSLVFDSGLPAADMMPDQTMGLLPPGLEMVNLGVPGQTTGMMTADAAAEVDPLYSAGRDHNVLVVWEGTNDLAYGTTRPLDAGQAYRHLAEYCRARRRAGFEVVLLTVLPREGSASFNAARSDLNERLRAGWRDFADALADVAADPSIGRDGAELDPAYYRDTVHLTAEGYRVVAGIVAGEVDGLL